MSAPRLLGLIAIAGILAACGGKDASGGPGSKADPLVASHHTAKPETGPEGGRAATAKPPGVTLGAGAAGAAPCTLVSRADASAILGTKVRKPLEAPQGPTCIYRSDDKRRFITLAVQSADLVQLKRQVRKPERVVVSDRTGFCGEYGQPMLYVPLARGEVLSVAGPCGVARRFAAKALEQLG
jgi:hypothetical protein